MSQKPKNLTGFDPKKFAQAAGPRPDDPWKRNEAWRYTGPFTRRNRWAGALPGIGIGFGLFVMWLGYEAYRSPPSHHGGHGGHEKDEH